MICGSMILIAEQEGMCEQVTMAYFKVISHYLPGRTEENMKILMQGSQYLTVV
jgi:hypothetical protein